MLYSLVNEIKGVIFGSYLFEIIKVIVLLIVLFCNDFVF